MPDVPPRPRRRRRVRPRFAVLGAGHGGLALAGHLAKMGFPVNLWNRTASRVELLQPRGAIESEGVVEGGGRVRLATTDLKDAIAEVDVIMVAVPANAHQDVARALASLVEDGQIIVLNPGRTGGALEVRNIFQQQNPVVPAPARNRRVSLESPGVGFMNQVGDAVTRVVPDFLEAPAFDHVLVYRKTLPVRRVDDCERTVG